MKNFKFIVFKIKSAIIPFCICVFIVFLLLFSNNNLVAAKKGISLWSSSVLPSLLPFFIATELLSHTNVVSIIGTLLNPIMRPLFNVPGEGAFALILGIISGYPVGAKTVANLKENGLCSDVEAERLIAFTNNSGPLFIIGTVGLGIFLDAQIGFILLLIHILASLTVGFIFRFWKINSKTKIKNTKKIINTETTKVSFCNFGDILYKSIYNSICSVVMIGGFIVFFSVVVSMLSNSKILYFISFLLEPLFGVFRIVCFNYKLFTYRFY